MSEVIEIKGAQIFRLRVLESKRKYDPQSKLKDDTYSRISFNGSVFTVNDKEPFTQDLISGKVHTVYLIEKNETIKNEDGTDSSVKRLQFDGYANNNQIIGMTKTEAVLKSISDGNFKADQELSDADMAVFQEAASS